MRALVFRTSAGEEVTRLCWFLLFALLLFRSVPTLLTHSDGMTQQGEASHHALHGFGFDRAAQ